MKIAAVAGIAIAGLLLAGCTQAETAKHNLSKSADQFEVDRRIVFYNGITDEYILTVEGKCSFEDQSYKLDVICKTGENQFKKHHLGLSDNVSYFVEQLEPVTASAYHYRVIFRPEVIVPDIEADTSGGDGE
ncbi:hypothetical protein [Microbacterium sp. YY-01]|uniref:beta-sandwich lipoprotein n=1 Tax=Microbacterium sp. YY-01 TaxID=3421634 RepID=UPI003D16BC42